jgi:hypothetical protein
MTAIDFPQSNTVYKAPPDMDASQVFDIPAHVGDIKGGNIDGSLVVTVAWQPSEEDLAALNAGAPVFVSMIGGLAPHMLHTSIEAVWPNINEGQPL